MLTYKSVIGCGLDYQTPATDLALYWYLKVKPSESKAFGYKEQTFFGYKERDRNKLL